MRTRGIGCAGALAAAFSLAASAEPAAPPPSPTAPPTLTAPPEAAARPGAAACDPAADAWRDAARWARLRRGMSRFEVYCLLGEPGKASVYDGFERWEYPGALGSRVSFDDRGRVVSWRRSAD